MKEEISLGELIVILLKFAKKNFLLFTIAAIIGAGIGYFRESTVVPKHKSEAVYCSDLLEANRLLEIVSDFETATKTGNYKFLAEKLDIAEDSARKISSIAVEVIEPEIHYRTDVDLTKSKLHQCIKVTCSAYDPDIFEIIGTKILAVFTNHEPTKQIVQNRIEGYKRNLKKIKDDVSFLTEQRILTYKQLQAGNSKIDINQFDNESQFIYAYEKIVEIEELVNRTKAAVLMKPFNTTTTAKHSKTKGIAVMAILFLGIAFAIAVFREIKV